MNRRFVIIGILSIVATVAFADGNRARQVAPTARAEGIGVNNPIVGRLIGSGNTLFTTSIDVSNNAGVATQVDFYFDAVDLATGEPIIIDGGITNGGLAPAESGTLLGHSSVHFGDFVDALVQAGRLSAEVRDHGVLGSLFLVFDGFRRAGEGSSAARFENAFGGGIVGVAMAGHTVASNEPQRIVALVRDTRGRSAPEVYTNIFINNTGLTPSGGSPAGPVTVELTARAGSNGQPIGNPFVIADLPPGHTRVVGEVFATMGIAASSEDTILVLARVTAGNAAIAGATSTVDTTTRDGSVVAMSRADF